MFEAIPQRLSFTGISVSLQSFQIPQFVRRQVWHDSPSNSDGKEIKSLPSETCPHVYLLNCEVRDAISVGSLLSLQLHQLCIHCFSMVTNADKVALELDCMMQIIKLAQE